MGHSHCLVHYGLFNKVFIGMVGRIKIWYLFYAQLHNKHGNRKKNWKVNCLSELWNIEDDGTLNVSYTHLQGDSQGFKMRNNCGENGIDLSFQRNMGCFLLFGVTATPTFNLLLMGTLIGVMENCPS